MFKVRPGMGSTRRLGSSFGEIEIGLVSRFKVDLPGEGGLDLPSKELEEHASRISLEHPLGAGRSAQVLFNQAKDALDIVDIADEQTVKVPIIDSPDDDLPLAVGQFSKGTAEKAGAGGTAVE
jgi:hypothetical protein